MKNIITKLLILVLANTAHAQITWTEITTPTSKDLNSIQFVDSQVGFASGDSVLLKTIDGGATWTNMILDSLPNNINQTLDILDMHWFDEYYGLIIAGPWGGFYETTDGGLDWEPIGTANAGFCQTSALYFFDEDYGFAGGAGCFEGHIIDRFENGTWSTTNNPNDWNTNNWVTSIEFKNDLLGFAGTSMGTLLRTEDGGLNWDTIPNTAGDSAITDFVFYGADTIRATHRNPNQWGGMISIDGGETWTWDSETATFFYPRMNAAHINGNGTTFLGGEESNTNSMGVIFDNSGEFWNWGSIDKPINDITSYGDSITFLVGDSGAIYTNVSPTALGITQNQTIEFNLSPNPADGHIQITGLNNEILSYTISDVSGRRVSEVEKRFWGQSEINVSNLTEGCYFLNLRTEQGQGTKRFVKL